MADPTPLTDDDRAELVAYLDGELDPAGAAQIETRIRTDPRLRAEADAYRQTWELLEHLPRPEPSPTLASRTLQEISSVGGVRETTGSRWPWLRSLAWAAGLLGAAGLGYALTPAPRVDVDLE